MSDSTQLVSVTDLHKKFNVSGGFLDELQFKGGKFYRDRQFVHAINGVTLEIQKGEALCLVGESGCGKTTVGRTVIGLLQPTQGAIHYQGSRIDGMTRNAMLPYRKKMQMIFQNPYASLNPRKTVATTLLEPVTFHFPELSLQQRHERVREVMESVGVDANWSSRFPHEFSGGQRQRISIARALMVDPEFIVADEPISALDVSIQAQVLNLLMQAKEDRGLTYLFITHDLSVVEHFGTRVAVMYLGRICELGETGKVFSSPRHPYTQALLSAIPKLGKKKSRHIKLEGEVPTPINLPGGCVFHGRCPHATERCRIEIPELVSHGSNIKSVPASKSVPSTGANSQVACHAVEEGRI